MLLVLTGVSCSGKTTLLQHILSREGVQEIRLLCTAPREGTDHVSDELFDSIPDMVLLHDGDYRSGISYSVLASTPEIGILQCNYDEAKHLSILAPKLNTSSVCVFLHCRVSELLCRLHERMRTSSDQIECQALIQDIYSDHNMAFVELEGDALSQSGFTTVLPVNTGETTLETYQSKIVKPLFSLFESMSVYKNMLMLRNTPVELMKYAN